MTALRIFRTGKPSLIGARVLPMSREDESFWAILAQRRAMGSKPVRVETAKLAPCVAREPGDARSAAGAQPLSPSQDQSI